jgi:hypothetical protein
MLWTILRAGHFIFTIVGSTTLPIFTYDVPTMRAILRTVFISLFVLQDCGVANSITAIMAVLNT